MSSLRHELQLQKVDDYLGTLNGIKVPFPTRIRLKSYVINGSVLLRRTINGLQVVPCLTKKAEVLSIFHKSAGLWQADTTAKFIKDLF